MAFHLSYARNSVPSSLLTNSQAAASSEAPDIFSPRGTAFQPLNGAVPACVGTVVHDIKNKGYAIVSASDFLSMLHDKRPFLECAAYVDSWNSLTPCSDPYYLFDGEMYHSRHYTLGLADFDANHLLVQPRRSPSYGHSKLSPLTPSNLGVLLPRIEKEVFESDVHQAYLSTVCDFLRCLRPDVKQWEIEDYQIRVQAATRGGLGVEPAPEGIHQDEVQHVFITMIKRQNIQGGLTYIRSSGEDRASNVLGVPHPLTETWETVILDDEKVWHQISAILPLDEQAYAYRDIIVVKCKVAGAKSQSPATSDE